MTDWPLLRRIGPTFWLDATPAAVLLAWKLSVAVLSVIWTGAAPIVALMRLVLLKAKPGAVASTPALSSSRVLFWLTVKPVEFSAEPKAVSVRLPGTKAPLMAAPLTVVAPA